MPCAKRLSAILALGGLLVVCGVMRPRIAVPQEAPQGDLIQSFNFDQGVGGWTSPDTEAVIKHETDPAQVKVGKGALSFQYTPRKGSLSFLSCGSVGITGANSATFYLKTSQPTVVVFILHEKDDSRYQAMRHSPAGEWGRQNVDFTDLTLADDSTDENGQLDVDQVDSVILVDMEVIFAQNAEKPGWPRAMLLDDLAFLAAPDAGAQNKDVLDDFESGVGAWFPAQMGSGKGPGVDTTARLQSTDQADLVKSGKHAMEYHYKISPNAFPLLMHQIAGRKLAEAAGVRLWVKTTEPTVLVMSLGERGGARYSAQFYCAKDRYQQVALDLADFQLDDDAKDTDGKLDLAEVNSITLADAAAFLAAHFKGIAQGDRTIYLDGLEVLPKAEGGSNTQGGVAWQDDFHGGAIRWLPLRLNLNPFTVELMTNATLDIIESKDRAAGARALQFSYFVSANSVAGLMRPLAPLKADSAKSFRIALRSDADTTLIINLKERDESEYHYQLAISKADGWKELALPLTDFKLGDDKKDENGRLDLDQLKEMALADISMGVGNPGKNTLWIESLSLRND